MSVQRTFGRLVLHRQRWQNVASPTNTRKRTDAKADAKRRGRSFKCEEVERRVMPTSRGCSPPSAAAPSLRILIFTRERGGLPAKLHKIEVRVAVAVKVAEKGRTTSKEAHLVLLTAQVQNGRKRMLIEEVGGKLQASAYELGKLGSHHLCPLASASWRAVFMPRARDSCPMSGRNFSPLKIAPKTSSGSTKPPTKALSLGPNSLYLCLSWASESACYAKAINLNRPSALGSSRFFCQGGT
jgi:hypothetical protein